MSFQMHLFGGVAILLIFLSSAWAQTSCTAPDIPINGGRDGSSLTFGSTVTYFCNSGYTLVGDNQRTCQTNGQFDGALPSCSPISCGNPGVPLGGSRVGNKFFFTNEVSYSCNSGFHPSGSQFRICLATGQWSGTPALCTLVDCADPGTPENGGRSMTAATYGSTVTYTCNSGYHLVGADRRQCQANGYWSLSLPECRSTVTCPAPETIRNGVRTVASFAVGSQRVFQCNMGYRMEGSARQTCQADGTWSLPLPTCTLITCQDPGHPDNGARTGSNFSYTAEVTYRCNKNYVLNGASVLRCISAGHGTGVWNASRPSCDATLCEGTHQEGEPAFRIRQQNISPAADIVIVVDESLSMEGEHQWLSSMVQLLDEKLQEKNIGSDANRRNHFALVGFGLRQPVNGIPMSYPHHYSTSTGKPVFLSTEFPEVAAQLVADGDVEDGYLAMSYGINNIIWPNGTQALRKNVVGVAQNMILITDEDRDILPNGGLQLHRSTMKRMLRRNNIVLNVVVDQRFFFEGVRTAIGMDYDGNAYVPTAGGHYNSSARNVRQGRGYKDTRRQYTSLALDKYVLGAAWDINILREVSGKVSASFTEAFVDVKTNEITRQVNQCLECRCEGDGGTGAFQCQRARNQATCCTKAGGKFTGNTCEA